MKRPRVGASACLSLMQLSCLIRRSCDRVRRDPTTLDLRPFAACRWACQHLQSNVGVRSMSDTVDRHGRLPTLHASDDYIYSSYGELAADHLRRIIYDLGIQLASAAPLDIAQLQQRAVFALTCLEAHDPAIPRYDLDERMPYAGCTDDIPGADTD